MPAQSGLLGRLAEEFAARVRAGELPSIAEYAARHPELAERIRALFPTLLLVESPARGGDSAVTEPDDVPAPGAVAIGQSFGQYRLVREIGRGGMGVVYEAVHRGLDRRVALKVLPAFHGSGSDSVERFLREARTAAALHHTNIVPVFDVGQCNGVPYFAMQLIEGRGLDRAIRDWQTKPPADPFRRAAYLGVQAAEALEHAHERGVIHRDVKPSNLLLDGEGVLWVADFGLARRAADSSMTQSGALVGTPRYMSPEQAEGARRTVDHRTDVYSLGATLYELLTCRPPFSGPTAADVLLQVIGRDPVPPCLLNPAIPRDLETVVLRAMAKRPEDRYQTAGELADDLRRCMEGEPVKARRIGALGRLRRWARRNPVIAALVSAVFVSLTAGAAVAGYFAWKADQRATQATNSAILAGQKEEKARTAEANAKAARDRTGDLLYGALFTLARNDFAEAGSKRLEERLAAMKPADNDRDRRGWEWHYLNRAIHGERRTVTLGGRKETDEPVTIISPGLPSHKWAWSDDLSRVAALDSIQLLPNIQFPGLPPKKAPDPAKVLAWDGATGKSLFQREIPLKSTGVPFPRDELAMSGDGRRVAWILSGQLTLFDVERNESLPAAELGGEAREVHLDPQGKRFVVEVQLIDPNRPPLQLPPLPNLLGSPPGPMLTMPVVAGYSLLLGDSDTGKVGPIGHDNGDTGVTVHGFVGDGRYVIYTAASGRAPEPPSVVLWDVAARRERARLPGNTDPNTPTAFALSPDCGSLAVSGPDDGFRVWDVKAARVRFAVADRSAAIPPGVARALAFSPDGNWLVSHAPRQGLRVWRVKDADGAKAGTERTRIAGCPEDATALCFSPDGGSLAVGDARGRITVYSVEGAAPPQTLRGHGGAVSHLAFREGSLFSLGGDGTLKEWDLSRPPVVRFLANETPGPFDPGLAPWRTLSPAPHDFAPDGWSLLVLALPPGPRERQPRGAPWDGYAWRRFDPESGKELPAPPFPRDDFAPELTQSRAGGRAATLKYQSSRLGAAVTPPLGMPLWPSAYHSLGSLCTTAWNWSLWTSSYKLAVWDTATNGVCFEVVLPTEGLLVRMAHDSSLALSPDGSHVAACVDGVHVWDVAGRRAIPLPDRAEGLEAAAAAFSPDSRRVAVLSREPHPTVGEFYRLGPNGAPEHAPARPAELAVLDLATGQTVWRRSIEVKWDDLTRRLDFTPDGGALVVIHQRRPETPGAHVLHVQVWATTRGPDAEPLLDTLMTRTRQEARGLDDRADVAFSPDGRLAALRNEDDLVLRDLTTGGVRHTLKGACRYPQRMTFSPDGTRLFLAAERPAVGDRLPTTDVEVFDTKSGQLLLTLPQAGDFPGAVVGLHLDGGKLTVSRVTWRGSVEFQTFDGSPE
jgi:WD40 repeat protein